MYENIINCLKENIEVKKKILNEYVIQIEQTAKVIISSYQNGKKLIVFGNGGSAADAQHLVGEMIGRFKLERNAFPAIALTTNTSIITAIGNDYGYDNIFERQIEGLVQTGDVVIGITTSGNSPNIIKGLQKARELGAKTIGLTGCQGGKLPEYCDECLIIPSNNTARIQEAHITIIHILCELIEKELTKEN